ncbi:MAG: VWA domain-containing protein [Acidobacteria bacterium]|nr:VWA domain-containing protein [Acidobacteriota bacterium]
MSFAHPWLLLLLALPVGWAAWEWNRTYRRTGLLIKAAVFALILLALSEPRWSTWERQAAVAVVTDESASVPQAQRDQERALVSEIRAAAGDNPVRPIAFGAHTRRGLPGEGQDPGISGSTNLEEAIRGALTALPADRVSRIVLASDGLENEGSVERAVYQARERGVPVDVVSLPGRAAPELRMAAVSMPAQAFVGERFPVELSIESPVATPVSIRLSADGTPLGVSQANLRPGRNLVTVRARLERPGAALIQGQALAAGLGDLPFSGVVSLATPRALVVASVERGAQRHLGPLLRSAGFEVTETANLAGALGGSRTPLNERFELIVLDNQDYEAWPAAEKTRLADFVSKGGGMLLVAGENNVYVERKEGAPLDPFNRMLPATLAPPRTPEGTAVVLVLDKSSSMEGKKMQLARQSAQGVVDNLRPVDRLGVLAFDNSFQWAIPISPNRDPAMMKQLISGIIADGGTQIAPALHEAYRQILPQEAIYKHILLLTDGISEEGDSMQLAREAAREKVTISTIGLGQDVNRAYLERVASTAEGRSYFVIDPSQLAQVVLRDVLEHTGSSVTEREFRPEVVSDAEILDGVEMDQAGPLLGWVKFEAKPAAETILKVDEKDPLLVRWQYGLGRAAVFASDANNRWAANWIAWDGFDRFWANVARDLLPRSSPVEATTRFDRTTGEVVVSYRSADGAGDEDLPEIYVLGPEGFRAVAKLERMAAGVYEARAKAGDRFGMFRFRPSRDLERFPESGYYRENLELDVYGSNPALLEAIASATGGHVNPAPADVFRTDDRAVETSWNLWPGLLALAILLNLLELLARKGWLSWLGRWA